MILQADNLVVLTFDSTQLSAWALISLDLALIEIDGFLALIFFFLSCLCKYSMSLYCKSA
jgi:competence protein ComGF